MRMIFFLKKVMAGSLAVTCLALVLAPAGPAWADDPKIEFEKYQLDNGMQVILHQDKRVPLVAVDVWYHVGAGDEVKGKSGFAHLFEHMLFQGSKHVGEDKHFSILKSIGASQVNGTTNFNRTNYYEVVPSNQLETALWLESDRMGFLLPMLTRKSLDNQIEVVRNERRQRIDNVPYGSSRMKLFSMMYPKNHPYNGVIIGDHKDLESATLDDVKQFYKAWYHPGNATLTLAGDFEISEAKRLVQKWFGSFPKTEAPKHKFVPMPKVKNVRATVVDKFAKLRQLTYAWHSPARFEKGDAELDVVADVLTSDTGRLYKILVHEKQWAQSVSSYQWSNQMSGAFFLTTVLKPEADLKEVEKVIDQELQKIAHDKITKAEMDRSILGIQSAFIWQLESLLTRAETLQGYNHFVGTPEYVSQDLDRYRNASLESIQNAVKTYLKKSARVEVLTEPEPQSGQKSGQKEDKKNNHKGGKL